MAVWQQYLKSLQNFRLHVILLLNSNNVITNKFSVIKYNFSCDAHGYHDFSMQLTVADIDKKLGN